MEKSEVVDKVLNLEKEAEKLNTEIKDLTKRMNEAEELLINIKNIIKKKMEEEEW
jgi:chaperonin cofactor prefoldin